MNKYDEVIALLRDSAQQFGDDALATMATGAVDADAISNAKLWKECNDAADELEAQRNSG